MIKIYADIHKESEFIYVEDKISSHDLCRMKKDELKIFIHNFIERYGEIHTCYSTFVNRVGRFIYEDGKRWCGQEFVVYTTAFGRFGRERQRKKIKHKYDSSGRIANWHIGYFG